MSDSGIDLVRDNVVVLHVRFEAYETLLGAIGEYPGARIAYDGEALEIMSPSKDHERYNDLLKSLVMLLGLEWKYEISGTGSMTLKERSRGAEPDSSFYVDAPGLRLDTAQLDLALEPAPSIVVEIDMSRARIEKSAIYAALGVAEFWRFDGERLRMFALRANTYEEVDRSEILGGLPVDTLNEFLERRSSVKSSAILLDWRAWLHANRRGPDDALPA